MKPKIKIVTDIFPTALLLMLMAYQIVGDTLREWYGAHWIFVTVLNFAVLK